MPDPKHDLDRIPQVLKALIERMHDLNLLTRMGLQAERGIRSRTRQGIDVEGRSFEPYSPAYAERRRKAGLPTHPVTLTWDDISGMMRRIDHEVADDLASVTIDITDRRKKQIAAYHDFLGVGRRGVHIRHFWGLSAQDKAAIAQIAEDHLNAQLAELASAFSND